jgi:hypothetical protein
MGCEGVGWIHLAQGKGPMAARNLRVPYKAQNFLAAKRHIPGPLNRKSYLNSLALRNDDKVADMISNVEG